MEREGQPMALREVAMHVKTCLCVYVITNKLYVTTHAYKRKILFIKWLRSKWCVCAKDLIQGSHI